VNAYSELHRNGIRLQIYEVASESSL
jgi:hypothetical protein